MATQTRSPSYPAAGLEDAIDAAEKLWKEAKRASVTHETAATAMGYRSLSGVARTMISTVRQYGLVEKAEKGHIRLTALAVSAIHGSLEERQQAIRQAAVSPSLFLSLADTHSEASESVISSHRITKQGFIEDGARKAAKAFRATMALANETASGYNENDVSQEPENIMEQDNAGGGGDTGKPGVGIMSLSVPYAKGNIAVQVKVTGEPLRPYHLARVRKYLELAEEDWEPDSSDGDA